MKLQDDLFIIRYKDNNIVYSPLRRALFFADNDSVGTIARYLNNELQESDKNTQVWGHITQLEEMHVDSPQPRQIKKGGMS